MSTSKLFQPIKVGNASVKHRVVLAPLTRCRATEAHVHGDLAAEHYAQRGSTPGTLLITEATFIAPEASGWDNVPGIWSDEQVAGWKKVTDAVHANRSFIFVQLWALGRAAQNPALANEVGGPYDVVSASNIGLDGHDTPRPLTLEEISSYKEKYVIAAKNAIRAGFDGVEIHNANGYLLDQFLQDVSNKRTDNYGGSIENRARFSLEVVDAVTAAIGAERTGIRFSPWSKWQDPVPQFSYIVEKIVSKYPTFAYLHLIESRPATNSEPEDDLGRPLAESNCFLRKIWGGRPVISAGGYSELENIDLALRNAGEAGVLVAFGKRFIANPDLPLRLAKGIQLNDANVTTFHLKESPVGYTDYPFAKDL